LRGMAPAVCSIASSRLVLPAPQGPLRATARTAAAFPPLMFVSFTHGVKGRGPVQIGRGSQRQKGRTHGPGAGIVLCTLRARKPDAKESRRRRKPLGLAQA